MTDRARPIPLAIAIANGIGQRYRSCDEKRFRRTEPLALVIRVFLSLGG